MQKIYEVIKETNKLTGETKVTHYIAYEADGINLKRALKRLKAYVKEEKKELIEFKTDEKLTLHIMPRMNENCLNELSKYTFHNVYAVCKKMGRDEKVLYLSIFKDGAELFKTRLPESIKTINGKEYLNPSIYIKEIRYAL